MGEGRASDRVSMCQLYFCACLLMLGLKSMVCLWVLLLIFELYLDTVFHGEVESQMRRDLSVLKCLFFFFLLF